MPRALAKIRKRLQDGLQILESELEQTLVYGEGIIGPAIELRTLEDWKASWEQWRHIVLPKAIEHRPGTRPFAMYVVGEIPEREVVMQPPLSSNYFKLYVPSRDGTGRWHCRYPEPFMRAEHLHLQDLGIIDDAEMKRARAWRKQRTSNCPQRCQLETYPLDQGQYE
jgi:hypothetical protein